MKQKRQITVQLRRSEVISSRSDNRTYQYFVDFTMPGEEYTTFTLSDTELSEMAKPFGSSAKWDCTRVVTLYCGHQLSVVRLLEARPLRSVCDGADVVDVGNWVADWRKLFERVRYLNARMVELGRERWVLHMDLNRFSIYTPPAPRLTIMQILKDHEYFEGLARSIKSFYRRLPREKWRALIDWASDTIGQGGEIWGGGEGEIGFKMGCGIYGGCILRDRDFSLHT